MKFPLVSARYAESLHDRVIFLEAELTRVNAENRDLVNSIAASERKPVPFAVQVKREKRAVAGPRGMNVYRRQKAREAEERGFEE